MAFKDEEAIPRGRSFQEYVRMFDLTDDELNLRILGCGDGPASFTSEMAKQSKRAISIDPIYQFSAEQIRQRIDETCEHSRRYCCVAHKDAGCQRARLW